MSTNDIYHKTPLGLEEMRLHKMTMKATLRRTLIMIDGIHSIEGMLPLFRDPKDLDGVLVELVRLGLVEKGSGTNTGGYAPLSKPDTSGSSHENRIKDLQSSRDPVQRFMDGKKFMNSTVREQLGFKAMFFTLKIEKCSNAADCLALLDEFEAAIAKAMKSDVGAEAVRKKAERILTA